MDKRLGKRKIFECLNRIAPNALLDEAICSSAIRAVYDGDLPIVTVAAQLAQIEALLPAAPKVKAKLREEASHNTMREILKVRPD